MEQSVLEQTVHHEPTSTTVDGISLYLLIMTFQAGEISFDAFCDQLDSWDKESKPENTMMPPVRGKHQRRSD